MSRVLRVIALVLALVLGVAATAGADDPPGFGGVPPVTSPTSNPPPSDPDGPVQTTVKRCSVFATSSNFGLSCITGGDGNSKTIKQILGDQSLPSCWDDPGPIPDSELISTYGITPTPGVLYYLQTCIAGLDPNRSPTDQPGAEISQTPIVIVQDAPKCLNYDVAAKKATPFTEEQFGHCIMTLTTQQQQVVAGKVSDGAQIPTTVIVTRPSTKVRTNQDVAFVDVATTNSGSHTETPTLHAGGVALRARRTLFAIYPEGQDGTKKVCDGSDVSATDTPQSKPGACWWNYHASSADQPDEAYPFVAEADWTVEVSSDDGATWRTLRVFHKLSPLPLHVYDIQTLVIN